MSGPSLLSLSEPNPDRPRPTLALRARGREKKKYRGRKEKRQKKRNEDGGEIAGDGERADLNRRVAQRTVAGRNFATVSKRADKTFLKPERSPRPPNFNAGVRTAKLGVAFD